MEKRRVRSAAASRADHDVDAALLVQAGHDEGRAPSALRQLSVRISLLFSEGLSDPEGELREGGRVGEESDVGPVFDHAQAEGPEVFDLLLVDE
ncbi:hypothetical protein E4U41_000302 [Claviceps citrina]|nr:hypothetical protein E4U41_000302 [Claviceps citrina]